MVLASVSGGSGHATRCYARATKAAVKRIIDQQNAADDRRDFRSARQDRTTMREVIRRRGPMLIPGMACSCPPECLNLRIVEFGLGVGPKHAANLLTPAQLRLCPSHFRTSLGARASSCSTKSGA